MQSDISVLQATEAVSAGDVSDFYADYATSVGVMSCDLETSGLDWRSKRVGLVQLYSPGAEVMVFRPVLGQIPENLIRLVEDSTVTKIFHHAMFDLRFLSHNWGAKPKNIVCTKIASKILNPEKTDHSLAALLQEYLHIEIDKSAQKSDWLSWELSAKQLAYAKADVNNLPALYKVLWQSLQDCGKSRLALECFAHLPTRVQLELGGYGDVFLY